jgi:hypothetical protein
MMVPENQERHKTAYTVTVDAKEGKSCPSLPLSLANFVVQEQRPASPHTIARSPHVYSRTPRRSQKTLHDRDTWSRYDTPQAESLHVRDTRRQLPVRSASLCCTEPGLTSLVDLCRLTGLPPAGLLCELVKPDDEEGSMARRDDCKAFAQQWGLKMISIEQLKDYCRQQQQQ